MKIVDDDIVTLRKAKHPGWPSMIFWPRFFQPSGVLRDPSYGCQNDNKDRHCHAECNEAYWLVSHDIRLSR